MNPLRLAVIGATRGIGRRLVECALGHGHNVRGMARRRPQEASRFTSFEFVKGEMQDRQALELMCVGSDVVCVCTAVPPTRQKVTAFSEGTRALLEVMRSTGPERLLVVTGVGAGESRGHGGWFYDHVFQPLVLKQMYLDKDRQEAMIKASDRDWVIVRPGRLTNGKCRQRYRVITAVSLLRGGAISRADVAHFLLGEIETPRFSRRAVNLVY
jgi:putative NADH-flavin reductase